MQKIEKNGNSSAGSLMPVLLHRLIVEEIKKALGKRGRCRNETNLVNSVIIGKERIVSTF